MAGVLAIFRIGALKQRPITLAKTNKRLAGEVQSGKVPRSYAPARAFRAAIC